MKVTLKFLKKKCACSEGVTLFKEKYKNKPTDLRTVVEFLLKENKLKWANWIVAYSMSHAQKISYAIFAAEQVIGIFEEKYPKNKRPRQAIEAAKKYLKDPSDKNKKAAQAAADAAYMAAYAANPASDAACAASYAAYAAADAAYVAAYAASAAYTAADAACAAAAASADAAKGEMLTKIINYGMKLMEDSK